MREIKPVEIFPPAPPDVFHHASSVVALPNGELLVAWYSGSHETAPDNHILLARLRGSAWSEPETIVDTPGYADGNPVLFLDAALRLWLFYVTHYGDPVPPDPAVKPWTYWTKCKIHALRSDDGGRHWHGPVTIREQQGWMTRNHPLTLSNGEILLPLYDEVKPSSTVMASGDGGETWEERGEILSEPGNEQPAVVEMSDGTLVALMRHRGTNGRIWRSVSRDQGRTWSPAEGTPLPNPDAGIDTVGLESDAILLAFNDSPDQRTPLSLALSQDAGQTWDIFADIESEPGEYSYPSLCLGPDGDLHLTYTRWRRTIMCARLPAGWLARAAGTAG